MSANLDTLARTLYGEARGEGWEGQIAVAWVVRNRAAIAATGHNQRLFGTGTIESACQAPLQFSCWNDNDPNLPTVRAIKAETDANFRQCLAAAASVMLDYRPDPTGGATHYFARSIAAPEWARGKTPTATIGNHIFFKL